MSDQLYRNPKDGEAAENRFVVPVEPDEVIELDEGAYTKITGPSRIFIFLGEGWEATGHVDAALKGADDGSQVM